MNENRPDTNENNTTADDTLLSDILKLTSKIVKLHSMTISGSQNKPLNKLLEHSTHAGELAYLMFNTKNKSYKESACRMSRNSFVRTEYLLTVLTSADVIPDNDLVKDCINIRSRMDGLLRELNNETE